MTDKIKRNFNLKILATVISLAFVPAMTSVYLGSSIAAGMLLVAILVFILNAHLARAIKSEFRGLFPNFHIFLIVIFCHSLVSFLAFGEIKPIISFAAIAFLFTSAAIFSAYMSTLNLNVIRGSIKISLFVLLIIGWFNVFYSIHFGGYVYFEKAVFPFRESSHYGLFVGPLSIIYCATAKRFGILLNLTNLAPLALLFESVTILIFCGIILFMYIMRYSIDILIALFFLVWFLFWLSEELPTYVTPHLSFAVDRILLSANNLSALIYLQGWDLLYRSLEEYHYLGVGFQRMALENITLENISYQIREMTLQYDFLNIEDGSFFASKIVVELGVLGLIALLSYLWLLLKTIRGIRGCTSMIDLHRYGLILSIFPELFVRGYGYFSPSLFLIVAFTMHSAKHLNSKAQSGFHS